MLISYLTPVIEKANNSDKVSQRSSGEGEWRIKHKYFCRSREKFIYCVNTQTFAALLLRISILYQMCVWKMIASHNSVFAACCRERKTHYTADKMPFKRRENPIFPQLAGPLFCIHSSLAPIHWSERNSPNNQAAEGTNRLYTLSQSMIFA